MTPNHDFLPPHIKTLFEQLTMILCAFFVYQVDNYYKEDIMLTFLKTSHNFEYTRKKYPNISQIDQRECAQYLRSEIIATSILIPFEIIKRTLIISY